MPTPGASVVAVTVLGDDRPGIVAEVTRALAGLGGNLEDSTMTLLRGHFAMVVLVRTDQAPVDISEALAPLSQDGRLAVDVRSLPEHDVAQDSGRLYVARVHGADRPGIVADITAVVASHGGNIVDLGTRLGRGLYVLVLEFTLPADASPDDLSADLSAASRELGVDVRLTAVDDEVL